MMPYFVGRSFQDVTTDSGRSNPDKADLKALLGIMFYPFLASANKQEMKDAVQGHLIPHILKPYRSIMLPTRAAIDNAFDDFWGAL